MRKIALIVNPWAGIGGTVGLKGSDGLQTRQQALDLGAVPAAGQRAASAMQTLCAQRQPVTILTCAGEMGENACRGCDVDYNIVYHPAQPSTANDTDQALNVMLQQGVDVVLFCGGDGTARDVLKALNGADIPVIGIPAGVKVYSAVFARSPSLAGRLCVAFLQGKAPLDDSEVMDLDEQALREDRVVTRLYGYLKVPQQGNMKQPKKFRTQASEAQYIEALGWAVVNAMQPDITYIIGPGTTTYSIKRQLNIQGTLVGVDVVKAGKLIGKDVTEKKLVSLCATRPCKIILTCIGGQGFLLGRGNQQISAKLLRLIGHNNIIAVATPQKLAKLNGNPMLVDTGSADMDEALSGYVQVHTGYGDKVVYPVARAG